jgi:hypothetical protein
MPVHYRHESKQGGPLKGAAFPIILPQQDQAERIARLLPESPTTHKLLSSALQNVVSAAKLQLSGSNTVIPRQTWNNPTDVKSGQND